MFVFKAFGYFSLNVLLTPFPTELVINLSASWQQFTKLEFQLHRMGAWLEIPDVEFWIERRCHKRCTLKRTRRRRRQHIFDLFVQCEPGDVANMNDVLEAPLWECEIPLSDDGF